MARFLVDEDLPRSVARELVAVGHDAVDLRDLGLRGSSDADVHARALETERALVTADVELANPFRYEPRTGTVLARFPNSVPAIELSRRIALALEDIQAVDLVGATVVVEPGRLRIRRHQ